MAAAALGGWWVGRDDSTSQTIVVPTVPATSVSQVQMAGGAATKPEASASDIDVAGVAATVGPAS